MSALWLACASLIPFGWVTFQGQAVLEQRCARKHAED